MGIIRKYAFVSALALAVVISVAPHSLRTWLSSDCLMTSTGFRRDLLRRRYCRARQAASRPGPKPDRAHLFRRHDSRGGIATRRACVHAGDDASAAQCARTAGLGHRIRLVLRADGGQRDPLRATLIRYHFAKEGRLPRGFRLERSSTSRWLGRISGARSPALGAGVRRIRPCSSVKCRGSNAQGPFEIGAVDMYQTATLETEICGQRLSTARAADEPRQLLPPQAAGMSCYSVTEEIVPRRADFEPMAIAGTVRSRAIRTLRQSMRAVVPRQL